MPNSSQATKQYICQPLQENSSTLSSNFHGFKTSTTSNVEYTDIIQTNSIYHIVPFILIP